MQKKKKVWECSKKDKYLNSVKVLKAGIHQFLHIMDKISYMIYFWGMGELLWKYSLWNYKKNFDHKITSHTCLEIPVDFYKKTL